MVALGFEMLVPRSLQAPIIVTFLTPADPRFVFTEFYDRLREKGFVIYPGKLTLANSFRIGCIGRIGAPEMLAAVAAVANVMHEMGVTSAAPAPVPQVQGRTRPAGAAVADP
jgi:2-aminoethylphosphonate-pyruvate transaminase